MASGDVETAIEDTFASLKQNSEVKEYLEGMYIFGKMIELDAVGCRLNLIATFRLMLCLLMWDTFVMGLLFYCQASRRNKDIHKRPGIVQFGKQSSGRIMWKIARMAAKDLYGCVSIVSCYSNSSGITFEVDGNYHIEARRTIRDYMMKNWPFMTYYKIRVYQNHNVVPAARSSVIRAAAGEGFGMVTGFFRSFHMRDIVVTAGHVATRVGQEVRIPVIVDRRTNFIDIVEELEIDGDKYTADLAICECEGDPSNCQNGVNKIDDWPEPGKCVFRRLWKGEQEINWAGMKVCVLDQQGNIRRGIIMQYLHFDRKLKLHNVVQVESEDDESFCKEGDSGASVFFASPDNSNIVDVFGMVVSKSGKLVNVVLLHKVLPTVVQSLPCLAKSENLPCGVGFANGLDFVEMTRNDENVDCKTFWSGTGSAGGYSIDMAVAEDDTGSAAGEATNDIQDFTFHQPPAIEADSSYCFLERFKLFHAFAEISDDYINLSTLVLVTVFHILSCIVLLFFMSCVMCGCLKSEFLPCDSKQEVPFRWYLYS